MIYRPANSLRADLKLLSSRKLFNRLETPLSQYEGPPSYQQPSGET